MSSDNAGLGDAGPGDAGPGDAGPGDTDADIGILFQSLLAVTAIPVPRVSDFIGGGGLI